MRFSDHRRQYTLGGLRRGDLAEDPVAQFVAWQDQAIAAGLADPTACVLPSVVAKTHHISKGQITGESVAQVSALETKACGSLTHLFGAPSE